MYEFIKDYFDNLLRGNGSVITNENTAKLNELGMLLYNTPSLNEKDIEMLKLLIMSCNILYNRTDRSILPIEDGFYDLLLEKYKTYDEHFQVGSAVVDIKESITNDPTNEKKVATIQPIYFFENIKRDENHQEVYDTIIGKGNIDINRQDFMIRPVEFENDNTISKRVHNTEHNHPSLVGTLDKCKFVLNQDAIDAGVFNDPNVKILERDFFQDHIKNGIIQPTEEIEVVVELKYDGVSVEGDCNVHVQSARSRGDTGIGEASDLTPLLKGYCFKHANCMFGHEPIGVKFEAIITKTNLQKFCELRGKSYANCRTAIIGLFGASDAYMFRDLITLIPLAIDRDDVPEISNRLEEIEFLNKVFISHGEPLRYCYFKGTVSEILYWIKVFQDEAKIARNYLDFMYDGIVVSYVDENIRARLGRKNYINKYSMAVKFDADQKQTIFRGYTYTVGQHGSVTPMIHYDPVEFMGAIHNHSTGSSFERFKKLGLKYGDYINVTYVNDVMPYVSSIDCEHNRNNPNPVIKFIHECPICGTPLVATEKNMNCPNNECPGRSLKRMVNMFDKLNIKGFADANVESLGINHLYEIFNYSRDDLVNRLGEANGNKLYNVLLSLRNEPQKDYIVMGALGFTSMAHKTWRSILVQLRLVDIYNIYLGCRSEEEFRSKLLENISGLGEVTSHTIARELPFFEKDILEILSWKQLQDSCGGSFKKEIRFTGIRNQQLSELLCNAGYDADGSSGVTKNTDILIVPYNGFNSSKLKKISDKCIVVPIDEFQNNMEIYIGEKLI